MMLTEFSVVSGPVLSLDFGKVVGAVINAVQVQLEHSIIGECV
jgi:hypothetical protein